MVIYVGDIVPLLFLCTLLVRGYESNWTTLLPVYIHTRPFFRWVKTINYRRAHKAENFRSKLPDTYSVQGATGFKSNHCPPSFTSEP